MFECYKDKIRSNQCLYLKTKLDGGSSVGSSTQRLPTAFHDSNYIDVVAGFARVHKIILGKISRVTRFKPHVKDSDQI